MSVSFKTDGVAISAKRDRAMFHTFAGAQDYVIYHVGQELRVDYSSNSFEVSLGTGEAVIQGGSMLSEGVADVITLSPNESGYLVIEIDLTQTGTNVCRFKKVETLVQEDINDDGYIYDFPLYQYQTNGSGVQNMINMRKVRRAPIVPADYIESGTMTDVNVAWDINDGQHLSQKIVLKKTFQSNALEIAVDTRDSAGASSMTIGNLVNNDLTRNWVYPSEIGKQILNIQRVSCDTGATSVADKQTATCMGTMNNVQGASSYFLIAERCNFGFITNNPQRNGTTITVNAMNVSGAAHTLTATVIVIAFK